MRNNQRGFGVVETLIAVLVVVLVAGGAYYFWHNAHKPATKTATVVVKTDGSAAKKVATNPYAGWKEYCSDTEKACFKYPADWTLTSEPDSADNTSSTKVTSPAGTVVVYDPTISGIGGGCDETVDTHIFVVAAVPQTNVSGLYVVQTGKGSATTVDHIGLSDNNKKGQPAVGDTGQCLYYTIFPSHADTAYGAWLQTSGTLVASDIPTVEKIMQSYYYQ